MVGFGNGTGSRIGSCPGECFFELGAQINPPAAGFPYSMNLRWRTRFCAKLHVRLIFVLANEVHAFDFVEKPEAGEFKKQAASSIFFLRPVI